MRGPVYNLVPPPPLEGGREIKGFGGGKGNRRGKKRFQKENMGKNNFWQYQIIKTG